MRRQFLAEYFTKEHLTKEEIEDKINESLKLQGLLLKDKEVILAMDNDFEKRKKSIVVNASLTAKGELAKSNSKGQITKEDFIHCDTKHLLKHFLVAYNNH